VISSVDCMENEIFSPVIREIPFEGPDRVYEKLLSKNSFFLESVKGPAGIARYSFICIDPYLVYKVKDGVVEIEYSGKKTVSSRNPLARLKELVTAYRQKEVEGLPPFQGGAAGIFCYDFARYLERVPCTAADEIGIPDAHFFMIDRLVAFDHLKRKSWIIVCPGVRHTVLGYTEIEGAQAAYKAESEQAADEIHGRILHGPTAVFEGKRPEQKVQFIDETGKARYMDMVNRAKEYIAAGDIFQTNLSLRVSAHTGDRAPWEIYRTLRKINPSPFSAFMDFGDYQIVSSSPERLVRVRDGIVDTRPIAGTRPRGRSTKEDEILRRELLLNEKERAEHIMLIDLERNDLGRISQYGSVVVDEFMVTEEYSHVMHIVSNVRGVLAAGKDCFSAVRAVFPGGTITGVPKVRCMEIIDEIERTRRGPYTGSLGYIGFNGNMDLNIVIRTFLLKGGTAYIQAGAGIVADSDPEREYHESMKKAEALIRTLEIV
jgi:para-aminobenzoate synthetase component 1